MQGQSMADETAPRQAAASINPVFDPAPDLTSRARQRALQAVQVFENTLTPLDFLKQIEIETAAGRIPVAEALAESRTGRDLRAAPVLQPFSARPVSPVATLYAGVGSMAGRRLLVAFCGKRGRLMMPMPLLLQNIDAEGWDVLVLRDTTTSQFRNGCRGLAATFPELVAWLTARAADYAGTVALGSSMGGFPALRLALRLNGVRGVCVGGRPVTDAPRLIAREPVLTAFDPICACLAPIPRDLILVCATGQTLDMDAAGNAAALTGGTLCPIRGSKDHNVLWTLYECGRLRSFLDMVMDTGRAVQDMAPALADLLPPRLPAPRPPLTLATLPRRAVGKLLRIAGRAVARLRNLREHQR
jgi:hypothetical protein